MAFTCARGIGNLWSICFVVRTLSLRLSGFKMPASLDFVENILLSKTSRILSLPSKKLCKFSKTISFICFFFFSWLLGFVFFLKVMISANKSVWYLSVSSIVILPSKISVETVFIVWKFLKLYVNSFAS